jgi:N-methylhydantoinase A/oxoprolinase/acetone carboxylase beta subunit
VAAAWAEHRPIETILSGPAASVVGGWHLGRASGQIKGVTDVWVVDVGGTTTDIASLHAGLPVISPEGARVGGWRTLVEAADVHTAGLGGDSHVRLDSEGRVQIGPRRAVPLSLLATEHPHVLDELRRQTMAMGRERLREPAEFIVLDRRGDRLPSHEHELMQRLESGPHASAQIFHWHQAGRPVHWRLRSLETHGLVRRSAFTPTDALHVLGRHMPWNVEAAQLGAEILARLAGLTVDAFCQQVVSRVSQRVAEELVGKTLEDAGAQPDWTREPAGRFLLKQALGGDDDPALACALRLRAPVVAIGAPVAAYMPEVARLLHTPLVIPPYAEVANAVGAVAGSVTLRQHASIHPLGPDGGVRLHLPDAVVDFDHLEDAVHHAQAVMIPWVEARARLAGADHVEIRQERQDLNAPTAGPVEGEVYLGSELTFIAVGRPGVGKG